LEIYGKAWPVRQGPYFPKTAFTLDWEREIVSCPNQVAAPLKHIGQMLLALDGTIELFRDSVFNYPTFAEAYKVAALNGLNKL
jgi:hypothetical protein